MRTNLLSFILIILFLFACKKEDMYHGEQNIDAIKKYSNKDLNSGPLDSLEFIQFISKQKLQEIYDLMLVQNEKHTDIKLNNLIQSQLKTYFLGNDSIYLPEIKKDLDTMQVKYALINEVSILSKNINEPDTIGYINYHIKYYNQQKKYISDKENSVRYILKKEKNSKQFKFYFASINDKDTIKEVVK